MTYLSYPALYTHNRNKHNIIPVNKKQEIFKRINKTSFNLKTKEIFKRLGKKTLNRKKFRYSAFNENSNLIKISKIILNFLTEVLNDFYLNLKSPLFRKNFKIENYPLICYITKYNDNSLTKVIIPNKDEHSSIDFILITYLLLLVEVSNDLIFIKNVVKFIVLLREYLNICGWEHKKYLFEFRITEDFIASGEFCMTNSIEEIPELFNDFIGVFIKLDEENSFQIETKNLVDLTQNFANWLLLNELTNFKILSVEETFNNNLYN